MYCLPKKSFNFSRAKEQRESSMKNVQEGGRDDEQVCRAPENRIETPEGDTDKEQVQKHPESHLQVMRCRNSGRQVLESATNSLQAQRSVCRNREPSSQL